MTYLYLFGFAALIVFFTWLGCKWDPDPWQPSGPPPHHPWHGHRAAVKAAEDALNPPPVRLTSREEVIWQAVERHYALGPRVPRQPDRNEGDHR